MEVSPGVRRLALWGVVAPAIVLLNVLPGQPNQRETPIPMLQQRVPSPDAAQSRPEQLAQRLERALEKLAGYIRAYPSTRSDPPLEILSRGFQGTELQPAELAPTFSDSELRLYRGEPSKLRKISYDSFATAVRGFLKGYEVVDVASLRVTRITESAGSQAEATVFYEMAGMDESHGARQDRGVWSTRWVEDENAVWLLAGLEVLDFSRQESKKFFFSDVTAASLGENSSFRRQLGKGAGYWANNLDTASQIDLYGLNGIAAADYDGDGWEDFYVCQPGGLPNRLFRNRGDGTFEDVTHKAGLSVLDATSAALWADYDNDGDQDLFVITVSQVLLFDNNGDGRFQSSETARFTIPSEQRGGMMMGALADYDRDGFLDLYVCQYSPASGSAMANNLNQPVPYHAAANGAPNHLYRNNGDGTFTNVTRKAGLSLDKGWSFAAAWADYDRDGYPDLYVANDFGANNLYRNNSDGTFTDIARDAGAEDVAAGMSASWEDYDNDGRLDLYVSNIWSASGQRVMSHQGFQAKASEGTRRLFQRFAKGNTLLRNTGNGTFDDVTLQAGVENGGWAWSSDFIDFNNDGREDLFILNGHVTNDFKTDLESFHWSRIVADSPLALARSKRYEDAWREFLALMSESGASVHGGERQRLYFNMGKGRFVDISHPSGLNFADDGRAFAVIDFDRDGDLDLIAKNRTGPQIRILRNDAGNSRHAVAFELLGRQSNRDAIGAKIFLRVGAQVRMKEVKAGSGFLSQHSRRVYFGIGNHRVISSVRIEWPSGTTQELSDIPADSVIRIEENNSQFLAEAFHHSNTELMAKKADVTPSPDETYRGTWLLDRLPVPGIELLDFSGKRATPLEELRGSPFLLNLRGKECEPCTQERAEWEKLRDVADEPNVIAVEVGEPSGTRKKYFATDGTINVLNSVVKNVFTRRREIGLPLTLLFDESGSIVKIYRGPIRSEWILEDLQCLSRWQQHPTELALPFRGRYYGSLGDRLETYFLIARDCLKNGLEEEALEYFRQCLRIDSRLGEVSNNIGVIHARRGDHERALVNFHKAAELDPQSAQIRFNIGTSLAMVGRLQEATAALDRAAEMDPESAEILANLGNAYLDLGNPAKAQSPLERALSLDPDSPSLRNSLATLYAEQGFLDRAVSQLREAVRLQPSYHQAWLNFGIIYLRQQKDDEARDIFRKVLELNPEDPIAKRLIDRLQ